MFRVSILLLMMISSACCSPTVSRLTDPGLDNVKESNFKKGTQEPKSSSSLIMDKNEPSQFLIGQPKVTKTKHLRINQQKPLDKAPMETHYRVIDNQEPFGTHQGNSYDPGRATTLNNDHVREISTTPNSKYSKADHIYDDGDTNGVFIDDTDQWFDYENQIGHGGLDICKLKGNMFKPQSDHFSCHSCKCSYTPHRIVIANCTSRKLHAFPLKLPYNTTFLSLSSNHLHYLDASTFLHYPFLLGVTLALNTKLTKIVNGFLGNQVSKVRFLNLTSCAIHTIQDGGFDLTPDIQYLIIKNNNLWNLTKSTFRGLNKLKCLDLSLNNITLIGADTFHDLNRLVSLDLSGNKELGYSVKTFSPLLFMNLKHLQTLSIYDNSKKGDNSYPESALKDLVELRKLTVDGLGPNVEFGPGMKSLKKLVSLEIRGNCQITNITETFFVNIPHLTSFKMNSCPTFVHVHPKAYTKLGSLETLSMSKMVSYDLDTAFEDLDQFNKSKLRSITFNQLKRPEYYCKYLGQQHALYLKNFRIEHLDLSGNFVVLLGADFLTELPKTLKHLILKKNRFTSDTQSIKQLAVLTGLIELDLSKQNINNYYDKYYSDDDVDEIDRSLDDLSRQNCHGRQVSDLKEASRPSLETDTNIGLALHGSENAALQNDFINTNSDGTTKKYQITTIWKIPPKLKILRASQYNVFGMQILTTELRGDNSLSEIDFSNSFMPRWGDGRLPPAITIANLGYNYCTSIIHHFFHVNNSHYRLYLNNNYLGHDIANDENGKIFSKLSKTVYLDISSNQIYKTPKNIFLGLSSLKHLRMSDNKLSILNVSFAHMKKLHFIDLSKNVIIWIEAETRHDLDVIAASSKRVVKIDLTMNPLPCTCDALELIFWMATTKLYFYKKSLLTCYSDNRHIEPFGNLEKRLQQLQRLCMTKSLFIIGSISALIVVMVIVILGLIYRYRWKLRYLHNIALAGLFGFKPDRSTKSGCTFDAYFVYTEETRDFVVDTCLKELELKRGHRLCVEDRDFLAGTYIVANIMSAVRNSTKTVVVMTTDLFEYTYCEYSFKMAVMEELYNHRSVLHLLMYKTVPGNSMSHDLLKVMERNSYTEYPPDDGADNNVRQMFWDKLSETIGHSGSDTSEPVLDID